MNAEKINPLWPELDLVLASASPRRRQILEQGGYKFITISLKLSEIRNKNLSLSEQIKRLAFEKAQTLVNSGKLLKTKDFLVLSGDTVVILDNVILEKPKSRKKNQDFLIKLSGKKHLVLTGVCLWRIKTRQVECFHECSIVEFNSLSEETIKEYLDSEEGFDKAGGYAIQGFGGKLLVKKYWGSYNNIVGLPIEKLEKILQEKRWNIKK